LAQCDGDDGVKDGIIGDPQGCRFDPGTLRCKAGRSTACLSEVKVAAARKIYAGPMNSKGESIYHGGALPGSELYWIGNYVSEDGQTPVAVTFGGDEFRYSAFLPDPGPSWNPLAFDFDRDYRRFGMMESLATASNPDLRKFKANGGKLLVYHGWADEAASPRGMLDYYQMAENTMGGREATQEFFRLFMIPGMRHCSGGAGAYAIDFLAYTEDWVERGKAPDKLLSAHLRDNLPHMTISGNPYKDIAFPLAAPLVDFTRPVYPYPIRARYKGTGDPNDAASFLPVNGR